MRTRCGVWIDHRRAVVVRLGEDETTVETVSSEVESRPHRAGGSAGITAASRGRSGRGGSRTPGPQDAFPEDKLDRKRKLALNRFYRRTLDVLGDTGAILVVGPAEAKDEFARTLAKAPGATDRSVWVEAADKLTERQLVARVREFFGQSAPREHGEARA